MLVFIIVLVFLILLFMLTLLFAKNKAQKFNEQVRKDFSIALKDFGVKTVLFYKRPHAYGNSKGIIFSFASHLVNPIKPIRSQSDQKLLLRTKLPHSQNQKIHFSVLSQSEKSLHALSGWEEIESQFWLANRYKDLHISNCELIQKIPETLKLKMKNLANALGSISIVHNHLVNQIGKENTLKLMKGDSQQLENLDFETILPMHSNNENRLKAFDEVIELSQELGEFFKNV